MTYFNELGQGRVGWRSPGGGVTPSTLWSSIYSVWNADTLGTSLDTSIYGVWNADATISASLDTSIFRVYNGDNVNDTSGNAQNGINVNNVTFTTGKVGNAFTFNGSNYVKLPNNSLNLSDSGSDAYSISLWGYLTNTGLATGLLTNFMQNNLGTIFHGWMIWHYGERIYFTRYDGTATSASSLNTGTVPLITMNAWHHIVVTRKNGSTKLYVDGVLRASDTSTSNTVYTTTHKPLLGARNSYNPDYYDWFSGNGSKIDGVNVWTKELTAAEVTDLYNVGDGVEYPFNGKTIKSLNDATPNANHGTRPSTTLTGGALGPSFTTGKIGQAFNFDGLNDYVSLGNDKFNFAGNFSISAWINLNTVSGNQTIMSNLSFVSPNVSNGWLFIVRNNRLQLELYKNNNTWNGLQSLSTLSTSTWYHVVVVRVASQSTKMYINGVLDNSNTSTFDPTYLSSIPIPSSIGAWKYDASNVINFTNGKIDALNIWNKELTDNEVFSLYNEGNGTQYPFSSQTLPSLNDVVGTNHGTRPASTLTGGVPGPSFTTGKIGKAFTFDGVNDYISLPTAAFNSLTGDFSVSAWVSFPVGYSTQIPIFSNLSATSWFYNVGGFWLTLFGYGIQFRIGDKTIGPHDTTTTILTGTISAPPSNTFVHIVATRKAGQRSRIYYNGVLIASNTDARNPVYYTTGVNTTTPSIGSIQIPNGVQSSYFAPNGSKIDALSVWNKELTAEDVTELYNSGNGKQYPN
jgi:hypothetical protein